MKSGRLQLTRALAECGRHGVKLVPLTQGQFAIVDDEDFERISRHKWYAAWDARTRSFYAARNAPDPLRGGQITLKMHRVVMGQPYRSNGDEVDHVNKNTLDNRKKNLQVLSVAEHRRKHRNDPRRDASEWGVGVKRRPNGRFQAEASLDGKKHHIGTYATQEQAQAAHADFLESLPL